MDDVLQIWDLWYPDAATNGLLFARGQLEPTDVLYVHSAPPVLKVEVRTEEGELVARGQDLRLTPGEKPPMTKLQIVEGRVIRQDLWPTGEDLGNPVILPGGEVGIMLEWWNAPDHSEWRWAVEFYNRR